MAELVRIVTPEDGAQAFASTTREPDEILTFDTDSAGQNYFVEIEGDIQVAGGGGGSVALYGVPSATGGYSIQVDNGAWVRRTALSDPVAGALSNGTHHIRIVGVIFQGNDNGAMGVEFGLNSQPGGATLTRLIGMTLRVMKATENFE